MSVQSRTKVIESIKKGKEPKGKRRNTIQCFLDQAHRHQKEENGIWDRAEKKASYEGAFFVDIEITDNNFSLHQSCSNLALQISKLAASLTRQQCKFETSYWKRVSHHASNLQQACCVKHIVNHSKNYADEPQIRNPENPIPYLSSSPLNQRDFDCGRQTVLQKDRSYTFYFKLHS
ncbi:hypothetical protein AVEN_182468-1 [Araneus ventricosus]|uniref:Uncharacterized protein n=1 Tax=Araneus ventricosus TaxID=182803 RepID=A0A4Y2K4Z8_ARAVE|nr:hypothetical protein AVEN_182468-1 [Araneus ventricosus]